MRKNKGKTVILSVLTFIISVSTTYAKESFMIATENVNFRVAPNTSAEIIRLVYAGSQVDVIEELEGWSVASIEGIEGFIKNDYLREKDDLYNYDLIDKRGNVELTPWSVAKEIFKIGEDAEIYDVYTGKVYYVRSFSNGSHADVEPITTEDTNIMFETFGRVWSWDIRPIWVTVGGKTMAASISGMPHGGGVNNSNGMDGQVCIHFLESKMHNGNIAFGQLHQDFVKVAFNYAN